MAQLFQGLYYPYIHFRDEAWLKRAALYWDTMARIVPSEDQVEAEDTDIVRALKYEAGFVKDLRPSKETVAVGQKFLSLLQSYQGALCSSYGLKRWESRLVGRHPYKQRRLGDELIVEVYFAKMSEELRQALVATGLAYAPKYGEGLIMHHKLAGVYMTALADEMAGKKFQPTTDNILNHFAIMGGTTEHIRKALLPTKNKKGEVSDLPSDTAQVAMFALQMIVPRHIEEVSVKDIIRFRKKYKDEVAEFREDVVSFAQDQKMIKSAFKDSLEFQKALQSAYHQKVEKKLTKLNYFFSGLWRETALAMLFISPSALVGKGLPALGIPVEPVSATIGAIALSTIPVLRQKKKEAKTQVGPTAYLLHAQEYFEPTTNRAIGLKRWARKFFFRV